jgi:hypothetical protein
MNGNGWMKYETSTHEETFSGEFDEDLKNRLNKDKGEESFKGTTDKKPHGSFYFHIES